MLEQMKKSQAEHEAQKRDAERKQLEEKARIEKEKQ